MRRSLAITFFLLICFSMTSCGENKEKNVATNEKSMVDIYYPEENGIVKSDERYQIKQPDSISYSVEEIMTCLMDRLDERMEYHTYMIDGDNNISLQFVCNGEYNREYQLLAKAAVVETIFQIDAINSVTIHVSDESGDVLTDNLYLRDSFYFYDYNEELNDMEVAVYYPDSSGTKLVAEKEEICKLPNVSTEESVIKILIENGVLPKETKINSITINNDICYVDFNDKFTGETEGVKSETVVYAVVNSVTSLHNINKVQITIQGEAVELYRMTVDISQPLQFNNEILK